MTDMAMNGAREPAVLESVRLAKVTLAGQWLYTSDGVGAFGGGRGVARCSSLRGINSCTAGLAVVFVLGCPVDLFLIFCSFFLSCSQPIDPAAWVLFVFAMI